MDEHASFKGLSWTLERGTPHKNFRHNPFVPRSEQVEIGLGKRRWDLDRRKKTRGRDLTGVARETERRQSGTEEVQRDPERRKRSLNLGLYRSLHRTQ